ncbi:MAG: hypothetical protein C4560_03120 [Nitrospiraceae bacterium]|nr:MAG: hypothetical protein C4560_03120 [Nitrospiraceae bacterium]
MSGVAGIELKFAVKRGVAWGTAVECGANDGVLVLPGALKATMDDKPDDSLGLFWPTDSDRGAVVAAEGGRPAYLRYDSIDVLIAHFMGTSGAPTYTSGVATNGTGAGSTTTLLKTGAGWTINEHAGKFWQCSADSGQPTNVGAVRRIVSNTADTLTFAAALPAATSATTQGSMSAGIATHNYDLADNLDGVFVTVAMNEKIGIKEAPSLKLSEMVIKGTTGNPLQIIFKGPAYNVIFNSAVNTLATFANVTYREQRNRMLYSQGVMRVNAQGGGALGSGDIFYPKEFELTAKRAMKGVYGAGGSFDNIDEPTNDGTPEVQLKITMPRHTEITPFTDWADSSVYKKMDITFTGALISGSSYRKMVLSFPNLKYANVDTPEQRGILENERLFNCLSAAAAPTGMTGITKPFRLQLVNTFGGDPLQAGN